MARRRKKGRKPKTKQPAGQQQQQPTEQQKQQPRHMREVVNSAMLINMLEKATAADQIVQLQQRVGCLQTEREQLRQRVADSEDQREAVFSSLKQTVVDAQTEIQVLVAQTRENDERRRREHEDTQNLLEERLSEVQSHRVKMACMQADIRQKNKALDELDVELRMAAVRDEELVEGRKRLSQAEKTLDMLRRKLVIVGRAGAGEEVRGAVADRQARKAEERASLGISNSSSGIEWTHQEIPGVGLTPLLMEGMNQFPEDVKLTRDTLALLGHVASMEAPGRSFLTAHKFYLNVVAALQRHVTDGVVALHAARLLHKTAYQGESSAHDLREVGVIPLLAEALAAAAYGPKGARRPRRLLYHAFGAIRLCYPKDFFHDSLQALRIQESTETPTSSLTKLSKTSENAEKDHSRAVMAGATASESAASSSSSAAAANEVLGPIGIHQPKESGAVVGGRADRFEVEKERWMLSSMPWADLGSHDSSKRQAAEDALAYARLRPLPTVRDPRLEGPVRRGSRKSSLRRPGPTPHHAVGAREKDTNVGNGYWDLVGGKTGLRGQAVEQREEVATATASVVLLRWAMEDKGGNEDVDMSADGVESAGENEWEPSADEAAGNKAGNRSTFGNHANAMVSGSSDLHANTSRDWHLPPDPSKERRQSESTTTVPPKTMPPGLSRSLTWVRPKNHPSRVLKSIRSEWQPRWPEQARRALEGVPLSALEVAEDSTEPSEGDGEQTALGGESSESPNVPNRWQAPEAHCVALHALVCLLRAVEVDACGQKPDTPDTGGTASDCSKGLGARGVATEKGVLLLVLKACDVFNAHAQVVTTCCMLMRIGVRYSEQEDVDEQSKQPSNSILSRTELLVRNSVGRVVRRAAKAHGDDTSVAAEVSALLKTLGMDPLRAKPLTPPLGPPRLTASSGERCLRRANTTRRAMAGILVDVEVVTNTEVLNLNKERRSLLEEHRSLVERTDLTDEDVSSWKTESLSNSDGILAPRLEPDLATETVVLNPE